MLTILQGDAIEQLRTLPDEIVHCCVTSPPYWGLRDYGTAEWEGGDAGCYHKQADDMLERQFSAASTLAGTTTRQKESGKARYRCKCGAKRIDSQLGLEKTPEEYVAKMVAVFREVRRVLRKDGTLWLNMGDSYCAAPKGNPGDGLNGQRFGINEHRYDKLNCGLKPKDLCGIPWRLAFALQADGWWLRSDIIWAKPNPMPESVTDRPTKAHEYIFLLTKSANYFYDAEAIKEKSIWADDPRADQGHIDYDGKRNGANGQGQRSFCSIDSSGRNKRTVWTVATAPYSEAHFATYPPDLIKPCILAGTSAKGCCTKCGSPWERIVEYGERRMRSPNDGKGYNLATRQDVEGTRRSLMPNATSEIKTIGWRPTCGHFGAHGSKWQGKDPQSSGHRIQKNMNALRAEGRDHDNPFPPKITIGWGETCNCESSPIPCTVLDPFAGSGTTGAVALELGRKAILIELNPKYVVLIKTRCNVTPGLQLA